MEDRESKRESLKRAFQLAYFIHGDRALAIRIVTEALAKLEMAIAAQDRRLYYAPNGRLLPGQPKPQRFRNRVSLSEVHLLQRLIYIESEPYERQQESKGVTKLDRNDMTIQFIKHLVKMTVRRNSFYVTLGLSRLLYNYSTAETMAIYNLVVQDPERVREDCYYRSRKRLLMEELLERFSAVVRIIRGPHGEERFQAQDQPGQRAGLVRKCLSLFTPWNTPCVVPDRFDPIRQRIPSLEFNGDDPDREQPVEVNRVHAVLDPDCYDRLIRALNLDPAEQRLAIPQFFLSTAANHDQRLPPDRDHPPELTEEEIAAIHETLAERARRRKKHAARSLSIVVDGVERARLDLAQATRIRFEVEESDELIEVRGQDREGEVLLAVHLLTHNDIKSGDRSSRSSMTLEGGQKICFAITPSSHSAGEVAGARVEVTYQETSPVRAAWFLWRRLAYRLFESPDSRHKTQAPGPKLQDRPLGALGLTRSLEGKPAAVSLRTVKRIYVASFGDDPFSQSVRERLVSGLQASERRIVTPRPEDADAALKRVDGDQGAGPDQANGQVALQLVNADGEVLWTVTGSVTEIVRWLMEELESPEKP